MTDPFPLYRQIKDINFDPQEYSPEKLIKMINILVNTDIPELIILVHVFILHHHTITDGKVWGSKKINNPYLGETNNKSSGIRYVIKELPIELCHILYKFMKFLSF